MNWKRLFQSHILDRGYNYYCDDAIENLEIHEDMIVADVIGNDDYEVEICLSGEEVKEMYCSCPYAAGGQNCKHMAAVLFAWEEERNQKDTAREEEGMNRDLFLSAHTQATYDKKKKAVKELVEKADIEVVKSYLISALMEDEKLLLHFYGKVNKKVTEDDVRRYINRVDEITWAYLGRDHFIDYHEAYSYISELSDILHNDVRQMMDHGEYMAAFEVMNHILIVIGEVDMDDSDGGTGMLGEEIYDLWMELLDEVDSQQKEEMFQWFTKHLNGSVADYLEEYIEQIILEEFKEKEYEQQKILFVQKMIKKSEAEKSEWSQSYNVGKWVLRYLELLEEKKVSQEKIEDVCRQYWTSSAVRKYYINRCIENKEYKQAIAVLNESISLDKKYRGLILDYVEQKKKLYLLLGDKEAYLNELWKLVLEYKPGDLEIYRELKKQYTEEDWLLKREELFQKISGRANVARLYEEEKLYDRLMDYVMNSQGMSLLQEYSNVLKEDFPEQILQKYKYEVNRMALHTGDRKKYQQLVGILRRMKKIKGGTQIVEEIVSEWKVAYRNRPAMMDELGKL